MVGYMVVRQRGSHIRLECAGRKPITVPDYKRNSHPDSLIDCWSDIWTQKPVIAKTAKQISPLRVKISRSTKKSKCRRRRGVPPVDFKDGLCFGTNAYFTNEIAICVGRIWWQFLRQRSRLRCIAVLVGGLISGIRVSTAKNTTKHVHFLNNSMSY